MRDVPLPSGAVLKLAPAPFAEAKALYQAVLEEVKGIPISSSSDMLSIAKDLLSSGFSSRKVEAALEVCMKRCLYNNGSVDLKIEPSTFEPVQAREDYIVVCMEVTKENVLPFMKGLYAELNRTLALISNIQT